MAQTSAAFRRNMRGFDGCISLSEIISALSYALDLTEGAVHGHALRSCLLGMRIAEEVKLPSDQTSSLYFALLLKDIGCSRSASRMSQILAGDDRAARAAVNFEDWSRPHKPSLSTLKLLWSQVLPDAGRVVRAARSFKNGITRYQSFERLSPRYDRGASILNELGMGPIAAEAVRSVDERWDGSGYPDSLKGEQIPLLARICAIAQHLDLVSAAAGAQSAIDTLEERSGTWFDPQLVRIAGSLHRRGALWNNCSPADAEQDTRQAVLDLDSGKRHQLESSQIDRICEAFADVVDAKSHFTFRHSQGVADAAFGIAQAMGLAADRAQLVRRAALLHDIGKLGVANAILDKKSQLSAEEWKAVYEHPRITRRILERVAPFREMAVIAGEHHEKLDGSGYPDHLKGPDLSVESRIVAVADVYAALSEDRPYRAGIELDETLSIMSKLIPVQLDADCFEALVSVVSSRREIASVHAPQVANATLGYPFKNRGFKDTAFESAL
ncbi:HD-GYP domain-containing protein [Tunturibacter empetritectus]|uniref:HD-GYP domain-containing protein (C-di-GMP phosphodiesterase class II) n=1 Tax=Tunturiibacter empetritectus TaxID=3069691 RepID=A0A7W8IMD8_9BACT|nr:HD-GYP domain-containing protein [Edaphobacter lichenicola]MBB5319155.1 HD-GYP domain-containing protein (c-di-GMP phosphodiesterase class II) [Edaphobacter lichenicola]